MRVSRNKYDNFKIDRFKMCEGREIGKDDVEEIVLRYGQLDQFGAHIHPGGIGRYIYMAP